MLHAHDGAPERPSRYSVSRTDSKSRAKRWRRPYTAVLLEPLLIIIKQIISIKIFPKTLKIAGVAAIHKKVENTRFKMMGLFQFSPLFLKL